MLDKTACRYGQIHLWIKVWVTDNEHVYSPKQGSRTDRDRQIYTTEPDGINMYTVQQPDSDVVLKGLPNTRDSWIILRVWSIPR